MLNSHKVMDNYLSTHQLELYKLVMCLILKLNTGALKSCIVSYTIVTVKQFNYIIYLIFIKKKSLCQSVTRIYHDTCTLLFGFSFTLRRLFTSLDIRRRRIQCRAVSSNINLPYQTLRHVLYYTDQSYNRRLFRLKLYTYFILYLNGQTF